MASVVVKTSSNQPHLNSRARQPLLEAEAITASEAVSPASEAVSPRQLDHYRLEHHFRQEGMISS